MKEKTALLETLEEELASATNGAERLKAQLALAECLEQSDYLKACVAFDKCHAMAIDQKNRLAQANALEGMGRMLWKMADYPKAHKRYQAALDIYTELGELYKMATSYSGLGIISSISEEHNLALEYFEKALSASRRAKHDSFTAVLTGNIGNVYFLTGRYDDAMKCFQHALAYHQKHKNDELESQMLNGMAGVHIFLGDHQKGIDLLRQSLAIDERLGRSSGTASTMLNIGVALRKQGRYDKAVKQHLKTLDFVQRLGYKDVMYKVHLDLSLAYDRLDEPEKSAHHLRMHMESEQEEMSSMVKKQNEQLLQYRLKQQTNKGELD